ncbi:MAG: type III pantothenate kinase [Gammaproteobacteria bacterium]|nr:type III pantothenate kinase [Gammaproteobacteria bacterium]MCD8542604.1 type III pantothenate kinase [Gammaproteobacteria bacterium]
MMLCLDVGNTHIFGGLLDQRNILLRFRFPSSQPFTSDSFGLFLKQVIRENGFDPNNINAISIGSVVPSINYSITSACEKYFSVTPVTIQTGTITGLTLNIDNPEELGADRVANAVAALDSFPGKNLAIFDFGTATTACAIRKDKTYCGGGIWPGFRSSMTALSSKTALLSDVEMLTPKNALGMNTNTQLQIGLYYSQLGTAKEILQQWENTIFKDDPPIALATGGYGRILAKEPMFYAYLPDLVLQGLRVIWALNSLANL